VYFLGVKAVSV